MDHLHFVTLEGMAELGFWLVIIVVSVQTHLTW